MKVPKGKTYYIGGKKFVAGDTIPESLLPKALQPDNKKPIKKKEIKDDN